MKQKRGHILTFSAPSHIPDVYNLAIIRFLTSAFCSSDHSHSFPITRYSNKHPTSTFNIHFIYNIPISTFNAPLIDQLSRYRPLLRIQQSKMHFHISFLIAALPLISGAPTNTQRRQIDTLLGLGTSSSPLASASDLSGLGSLLGGSTGTDTTSGLGSLESGLSSLGSLGSGTGTSSGLASLESEISSLMGGTGTLTGASASSSEDALSSLLSGLARKEKKV